jgi:hypothetical protein
MGADEEALFPTLLDWLSSQEELDRGVAEGRFVLASEGVYFVKPHHDERLSSPSPIAGLLTMGVPDFSCIPCAGKACFPRPPVERKACERPHMCPARPDHDWWQCRCCADCKRCCSEEA